MKPRCASGKLTSKSWIADGMTLTKKEMPDSKMVMTTIKPSSREPRPKSWLCKRKNFSSLSADVP